MVLFIPPRKSPCAERHPPNNVGNDEGNGDSNSSSLCSKRKRESRCADCGAQTHRIEESAPGGEGRSAPAPSASPGAL